MIRRSRRHDHSGACIEEGLDDPLPDATSATGDENHSTIVNIHSRHLAGSQAPFRKGRHVGSMTDSRTTRRDDGVRRIGTVTGTVAVGAALASGVIAGVAAHHSRAAENTGSNAGSSSTRSDDTQRSDDSNQLQSPSQAPNYTYQPPVTRTSGS